MAITRESKMTGIKPSPVPLRLPQIPRGLVWSGTEASVLSTCPQNILYRDHILNCPTNTLNYINYRVIKNILEI